MVYKSNSLERLAVCLLFVSFFVIVCSPYAEGAADERGLWTIWGKHKNADTTSKEVITACMEFNKTHTGDPLVKVTDTLAAWHLLKLKKYAEASALMAKNAKRTTTSLGKGADQIASTWLSRIDIMRIRAILQFYYRKEIEYPENLEILANYKKLSKELSFPLKDRFGKPWSYKLVGFTKIPNMLNQKYSIRCAILGMDSDLEEAIKRPYGDRIKIRPIRKQIGSRPGAESFEIAVGGEEGEDDIGSAVPKGAEKVIYSNGTRKKNLTLCYIGSNILIFCDRDHWEIVGKPRK